MSRVVAFADAQRMLLPAPPLSTAAQSAQLFYKDIFSLFKRRGFSLATQLFFSFLFLDFSMASVEHLTIFSYNKLPLPGFFTIIFFVLFVPLFFGIIKYTAPTNIFFRPCRAAVSAHAANFVYFFFLTLKRTRRALLHQKIQEKTNQIKTCLGITEIFFYPIGNALHLPISLRHVRFFFVSVSAVAGEKKITERFLFLYFGTCLFVVHVV